MYEQWMSITGLAVHQIPDPAGSLNTSPGDGDNPPLIKFAYSVDPAGLPQTQTLSFLAAAARDHLERTGALPELDLDGCRACLYYEAEHRRHNVDGWEREFPDHATFLRALVGRIAALLQEEESFWALNELTEGQMLQRALGRSNERLPFTSAYKDCEIHLRDVIGVYEGAIPDDDDTIVSLLDPPVLEEDPIVAARLRVVQTLALGLWMAADGSGFSRVRAAEDLARGAHQAITPSTIPD